MRFIVGEAAIFRIMVTFISVLDQAHFLDLFILIAVSQIIDE
jgi:hypothetical protein